MWTWRQLMYLIPAAAIGPAILWASPYGPARNSLAGLGLLVSMYPVWVLFVAVYVLPPVLLVRRFRWNPWIALPLGSVLLRLLVSSVTHWPPSRWWPAVEIGLPSVPSAYVLSFGIEAWHGYLHSLWPGILHAFVAAGSFLVAQHLLKPDNFGELGRDR